MRSLAYCCTGVVSVFVSSYTLFNSSSVLTTSSSNVFSNSSVFVSPGFEIVDKGVSVRSSDPPPKLKSSRSSFSTYKILPFVS